MSGGGGPRAIEVRWFAALAERAGTASETVAVPPGTSVEALWRELVARHPRLADLGYRPRVVCDLRWSDWDASLDGVGQVAFLAPVSGG